MDLARMIDILERAKHDHYSEPEGLASCPATSGRHPGPRDTDEQCDCGADEINSEIDEVIAELKKIGDALLAEPITITQPPDFSDDEVCGYCGRLPGQPHDRQRCR